MLGETRGWNAIASSRTRDATARADLDPTIPSTKMLHTKKQRFWREYRAAVSEYHRLTNYLIAARRVLTGPERALLVEFADLAKRKSARLRRVVSLRIRSGTNYWINKDSTRTEGFSIVSTSSLPR